MSKISNHYSPGHRFTYRYIIYTPLAEHIYNVAAAAGRRTYLSVLLGLRSTWMLCIRESSSESDTRHIRDHTAVMFFVLFSLLAAASFLLAYLVRVQREYPQVSRAFLRCVCFLCFPSALLGIVSAQWCRVQITPIFCSRGWGDSKRFGVEDPRPITFKK